MFKETKKDLGTLAPNQNVQVEFQYEGDLNVKNIFTTCGCTEAKWDEEKKLVKVTYRTQPIPEHIKLQNKNNYIATKQIKVVTENEEIKLSFTALIKE